MFASNVINELAARHAPALKNLHAIEQALNQRFFQVEEAVSALVLAVASGEPLLLIGEPGTAKSRMIRVFCGMVGLLNLDNLGERKEEYFEYLLTPFTEPGELFGYYDISRAQQGGGLHRDTRMMMQQARVVYLDEVFNASSAILNTLLAFINERYFHDRGDRVKVALECLFAATNVIPDTPELLAIYDRFLLRCHVHYAEPKPESIGRLLNIGWSETYGNPQASFTVKRDLLQQLKQLRDDIRQRTARGELVPDQHSPFYTDLAVLINHAREYHLSEVSNRRLVKMIHVMLIHRLYQAVAQNEQGPRATIALGVEQLNLFGRFFLDHADDPQAELLEGARIAQRI